MTVKTPEAVGFLRKMNAPAPFLRDYIQKTFEITDSEAGVQGLLYGLRFAGIRPPGEGRPGTTSSLSDRF